jgi:hypothetical protein
MALNCGQMLIDKEVEMIEIESNIPMTGASLAGDSRVNKRRELDFYPTPPDATQALINTGLIPKGCLWEPACGEGHMAEVFKANGFQVVASDITPGYGVEKNFLETGLPYEGCSIVTNPPFNISHNFIEHCAELKAPVFAMLLKSQYWHSKKRIALFEKNPPSHILALTWRLDFCFGERGGAPTMECIWCVWTEGATETKYQLLKKP